MKVTVLDKISFTVGDIDLTCLDNLGNVEYYDVLTKEEIKKVCVDSEVIVCNKTVFDKELLDACKNLKFIAITATGYNNIDLAYAKEKGVDLLFALGNESKEIYNGFADSENSRHFDNIEDIISIIGEVVKSGDTVLIKGSRGMHTDLIAKKLDEILK